MNTKVITQGKLKGLPMRTIKLEVLGSFQVSRYINRTGGKNNGWQVRYNKSSKLFTDDLSISILRRSALKSLAAATEYLESIYTGKPVLTRSRRVVVPKYDHMLPRSVPGIHMALTKRTGEKPDELNIIVSAVGTNKAKKMYVGTVNTVTKAKIRTTFNLAVAARHNFVAEYKKERGVK